MDSAPTMGTTVSTKGQVILPKAIRSKRRWGAGTRLLVEDTAEGVLLKAAPAFEPSKPEAVFGMLKYAGAVRTVAEMDGAIADEVQRRHARNRY